MKHSIAFVVLFAAYTSAHAQNLNPSLQPFKFLLGSWTFKNEKTHMVEIWEGKDTSCFAGRSYRIDKNGDSTLLETVILQASNSGLFYIPVVRNQNDKKPISFKLISSDNHTYTFENKAHDFPQRVVYQLKGENELLAWIEGEKDGKKIKSMFPYKRVIKK